MAYDTFKDELRYAFPLHNDEVNIDFLLELLYFFPIEKTYISTGSYDQYLYDLEKTVIDNYENGNYQVSFFYAHLIFMSYVYYCVEKAYQLEPNRMKDIFYPINSYRGRDDKPNIENYKSVYEFSKIPEKDIFKVFHIINMDDEEIKSLSRYISSRDDFAHATGEGNISEDTLQENIKSIIGNMNMLHKLFEPYVKRQYVAFMLKGLDDDFETINENFADFIFDNSMSIEDLKYLSHIGINALYGLEQKLKDRYQSARNIHCAFIEYCRDNEGIEVPDGYISLRNEKYSYFLYKNHADDYVKNELEISSYRCTKDGIEFPVYECPNCEEEQLVYNKKNDKYHCFHCDTDFSDEEISFCSECYIPMKNAESCICNACLRAKMEKE